MPADDGVTGPDGSSDPAGDAIRARLTRAVVPADPAGAYERVVEKKVARRVRRRVGTVVLAVTVVAGTATGSYALIGAFRSARTPLPPAASSSTGFTNGLIAFVNDGGPPAVGDGIYVARPDGTGVHRLGTGSDPSWSADGSKIAFRVFLQAPGTYVYVMNADGSGSRLVAESVTDAAPDPAWLPGGSDIVYVGSKAVAGDRILSVPVSLPGVREGRVLAATSNGCSLGHPAVSRTGTIAVRVLCPAPVQTTDIELLDQGTRRLVPVPSTTGAGAGPAWAPDGRTLLFGRGGAVYSIRSDGTDLRHLASVSAQSLSYSPDGTKIMVETAGAAEAHRVEVMDAEGRNLRPLPLPSWASSPSWQPVPIGGVPTPSHVHSPSPPSPAPSPSPSPSPSPTDLCPTTLVDADFDGDGTRDTATVEAVDCPADGVPHWTMYVVFGGGHHPPISWDLPECEGDYAVLDCAAVGSIPMNDGTTSLALRIGEGASTVAYEMLNMPPDVTPQEYLVTPPGSPEFPPGHVAVFYDEGSVTHEDFFRCQGGPYPGGGDQATIVETDATLNKYQGMYTLVQTVLAHGPNSGQAELIVVSRDTRKVGFDAFSRNPGKYVQGAPCW